jgi:hypothetical protein
MSYYNTTHQNRTMYSTRCVKCNAPLTSNIPIRKSCRNHSYFKNDKNQMQCRDCHKIQCQSSHNCYHIGKKNELCCIL